MESMIRYKSALPGEAGLWVGSKPEDYRQAALPNRKAGVLLPVLTKTSAATVHSCDSHDLPRGAEGSCRRAQRRKAAQVHVPAGPMTIDRPQCGAPSTSDNVLTLSDGRPQHGTRDPAQDRTENWSLL